MSLIPKARFTHHAYLRVVGGDGEERRLKLSSEEVSEILDDDKAVPVGRDPKESHKIHRAFYSIPDDECIVAVQDERNGEVITLLPFSHHGRFVLDSTQVRKMAMRLVGVDPCPLRKPEDIFAGPETDCVVAVELLPPEGSSKTVRLMRFPVAEGISLRGILADGARRKEIETEYVYALQYRQRGTQVTRIRMHFVSGGQRSEFQWFEKDGTPCLQTTE